MLTPYSTRFVNRLNLSLPWKRLQERVFGFDPQIFNSRGPIYLDGHWQSYHYFDSVEVQLRRDLSFTHLSSAIKASGAKIQSQEYVMLHIRRGDYISNPSAAQRHGILPLQYYQNAISILGSKLSKPLRILVFSDDYEWCKENLRTLGGNLEFTSDIDPEGASDMYFMSLCKHHIIANSTYSWWGAWLAGKDGLTIAPKSWFADGHASASDLIPPHWTTI
jgi:hypothetical protein